MKRRWSGMLECRSREKELMKQQPIGRLERPDDVAARGAPVVKPGARYDPSGQLLG
jgi:hypothetical protein